MRLLRTLLNRDLGADLRTIIGLLGGVIVVLQIVLDEVSKFGATAALSIPMLLSIVGRFTRVGNNTVGD